MDAVLYLQDRDHVLVGKENGVVGTSNLLEMVPGVLEGKTSGGFFLNSIFDPSVIGASVEGCGMLGAAWNDPPIPRRMDNSQSGFTPMVASEEEGARPGPRDPNITESWIRFTPTPSNHMQVSNFLQIVFLNLNLLFPLI